MWQDKLESPISFHADVHSTFGMLIGMRKNDKKKITNYNKSVRDDLMACDPFKECHKGYKLGNNTTISRRDIVFK